MLTRPGAGPGCGWMRQINEKVTRTGQESETAPRWWKRYWLIYGSFMFLWLLVLAPLLRHSVPPVASPIQNYESETRIAGLPLWARGSTPRGIIAIGGQPIGLVAIGGLPVGIIAVGGAGAGIFCFSGLAVGLFALGGGAVGWWSLGGGAVGYYAFGGLSVGGYAYAGNGVALGYYEASGRQKEKLWG